MAAHRSPTEILKAISGFVASAAAVGAYLTGALARVNDAAPYWVRLPETWIPGTATLLVGGGAFLAWHALRPRSRLLRPDATVIMPSRPEHLVGRDEDLEQLRRMCAGHSLVFLIGESGSGKSALLRAGLMEAVGAAFVPVYLDSWGEDWERGPSQSLAVAVSASLSPEERERVGEFASGDTASMVEYVRRARAVTGRRLLLILDQFDDYVAAHQHRFVARGVWIDAGPIAAANSFWRAIAQLVGSGDAHAVVAVRSDAAPALDSVRFTPAPIRFSLERLRASFVEPLLRTLTEPRPDGTLVVSHPENGWIQLQRRLVHDLSAKGVVLAAQMRLVLAGLDNLNPLSIASYERLGGIKAVEAAHVRRHVAEAARIGGLSEAALLRVLIEMTDTNRGKTVARSLDHLVDALASSNVADGADRTSLRVAVDAALTHLMGKHLVRRLPDPLRESAIFALAHDYLSRSAVELQRASDRWERLLEEHYDTFLGASGDLWRQYKALLSPVRSAQLLLHRPRGGFRYGEASGYALLSIVKFLPILAIVALTGLGSVVYRQAQQEQESAVLGLMAQDILNRVGRRDEPIAAREREALWNLTVSYEGPAAALAMKLAFLRAVMSSSDLAERFLERPEHLLRALWGTDAALADYVCSRACWPQYAHDDQRFMSVQAIVGARLRDFNAPLLGSVLTNLRFYGNGPDEAILAARIAAFARRADSEYARMAFFRLLPQARNSGSGAPSYARVLGALAERLGEDARAEARMEVDRWKDALGVGPSDWPGSPAADEREAIALLRLTLAGPDDTVGVDAGVRELFTGPPAEGALRSGWRPRPATYAAIADLVDRLPPKVRTTLALRVFAHGTSDAADPSSPTGVDDAFFALLAKLSDKLDAQAADTALASCAKYRNSTFRSDQLTPRQACHLVVIPRLGPDAADGVMRAQMKVYERPELLAATASRVSSGAAADLIGPQLNRGYFSNEGTAFPALAMQIDAQDARRLISADGSPFSESDRADVQSLVSAMGRGRGDAEAVLGVLAARGTALSRTALAEEVLRTLAPTAYAPPSRSTGLVLALAALSDAVPEPSVPAAFRAIEDAVVDALRSQPVVPAGVVIREERSTLRHARPGLEMLAVRLPDPHAKEAAGRWLAALRDAAAEDVESFGPVIIALARPGVESGLFDAFKRPDFRAMAEMRATLTEALRRIWHFSGTDEWTVVDDAAKRGLNVRGAPAETLDHYFRLSDAGDAP